ncbi:MAG: 16S rRNA (cytosine(967)-C(5))-methyltransferase RsmB [Oscillospiraceae bacterium]|nr:16S rRNA (cytosine(967)-C(5))-methyltransferase RsmB [Oscillospiraceae bacterium]
MIGLEARLLCVRTLIRSLKAKSYSNLALTHALMNAVDLTPQESALCRNLFRGTFDRMLTLDACIAAYVKRPLEKLDTEVLCVLRCGVYELLYLSTPESAAVNLWTECVKKLRKGSASGMVNAVLRGFLRSGKEIPYPADARAAMSVRYSVAPALLDALLADYDEPAVTAFLEDAMAAPPVYLRRNPLCENSERLMPRSVPVDGIPGAYVIEKRGETAEVPTEIDGKVQVPIDPYRSGLIGDAKAFGNKSCHVQDLASQLCCMALDAQPGETVLDVCAAPGGKTFTIAEMMQNTGRVCAYDLHENRVKLIRDGAKRLGLTAIEAQAGDARETDKPQADRILCDVPCSGYGVIRRKPELRYKSPAETAALPEIQLAILEAAAKALKPGGVLVYSTCTVLKRENEAVVRAFLSAHPEFQTEKPWDKYPALKPFAKDMTTLFPAMVGSDGFFLCKMRKREA